MSLSPDDRDDRRDGAASIAARVLSLLLRGRRTLRLEDVPTGLGLRMEWPELISLSTDSASTSLPSAVLSVRARGRGGGEVGLLGSGEE